MLRPFQIYSDVIQNATVMAREKLVGQKIKSLKNFVDIAGKCIHMSLSMKDRDLPLFYRCRLSRNQMLCLEQLRYL